MYKKLMKVILLLLGVLIVFGCNAQPIPPDKNQSIFINSDNSYCHVYSDSFAFKNVTYSKEYFDNDKGRDSYIVRKTNYINFNNGMEGQYSTINLNIYSLDPTKLVKSMTKDADEVFLNPDYLCTIKYGCCAGNNTGELSTIWDNKTFLKYDTKYFYIEINDGRIKLFFGYVGNSNQGDTIKGTLYYVIAMGERIKGIADIKYTYKYHDAGKVIFKAKATVRVGEISEASDEGMYIYYLSNSIDLIKNTKNDWQYNDKYCDELRLYSLGRITSLNDINVTPLQIRSLSDTVSPISIPIIHGYLFGDSLHTERTIYIK
jgi:hypothetical protein